MKTKASPATSLFPDDLQVFRGRIEGKDKYCRILVRQRTLAWEVERFAQTIDDHISNQDEHIKQWRAKEWAEEDVSLLLIARHRAKGEGFFFPVGNYEALLSLYQELGEELQRLIASSPPHQTNTAQQ